MSNNRKQYCIVEHIWRLGRWLLGAIVIIVWFTVNTLPAVLASFVLLGIYEQLHGYICHKLEQLLKFTEQHEDFE